LIVKDRVSAQDFFEIRRLSYEPSHLATIDLSHTYNMETAISKWIDTNLKKRYFLKKVIGLTKENKIETVLRAGFEDPKELSYFVLACPLLKYK
jgi:hypothetical protein|tara:strand:- start:10677 stop:10958 length:282 start_codon:yes stop_codon:yes gene_type:complete